VQIAQFRASSVGTPTNKIAVHIGGSARVLLAFSIT